MSSAVPSAVASTSSGASLDPAKVAFIQAAIDHGVLLFGEFTLKSGR